MSTAETVRTVRWWPSRYGQDDEIGSLDEVKARRRFGGLRPCAVESRLI